MSCTLLTTVLAVATPLVVRHGRLLTAQRDYRVALDELSNQLERLTALPPRELAAELDNLKPSPHTAGRLRGAELRGELQPAEFGQRLTLRLAWDEPQRAKAPVVMAAWIFPNSPPPGGQPPGGQTP
ncbi:MAG: hypothetical protein WD669_02580 [Pirellulales bacterium]